MKNQQMLAIAHLMQLIVFLLFFLNLISYFTDAILLHFTWSRKNQNQEPTNHLIRNIIFFFFFFLLLITSVTNKLYYSQYSIWYDMILKLFYFRCYDAHFCAKLAWYLLCPCPGWNLHKVRSACNGMWRTQSKQIDLKQKWTLSIL